MNKKLFLGIISLFCISCCVGVQAQKEDTNSYYFILKGKEISSLFLKKDYKINYPFNEPVTVVDTLRQDLKNGIKFYWLKVEETEQQIPSTYLSKFRFPYVKEGKDLGGIDAFGKDSAGDNSFEKGWLYSLHSFNDLLVFFFDSLGWESFPEEDFLTYGTYDEESYHQQYVCRISPDYITFFTAVQLFYHIANLSDKHLIKQQDYLYNDDVKIWYTIYKSPNNNEHEVFCRVIEKDGYIQMAIDYELYYDQAQYGVLSEALGKVLKNKAYDEAFWGWTISFDGQF